jgi:aspartyl-tRNA(Asn)/glutamyl-tRNA(Gln) amidotransferase subunit B
MSAAVPDGWEAVIGLEIHVQLDTETKMFCRCENATGGEPNTRCCPVCTAQPGALPTANRRAVEKTIEIGLALGSQIADQAVFARKNYFYPDSPKGYQISQYEEPLCIGGILEVPTAEGDEAVRLVRAHLEEDAAKTVHAGGASGRITGSTGSVVDFNRCGTPLVEIVTEPDLRSPEQVRRFVTLLRATLRAIGASECDMENGSMRADANVSLRRPGEDGLRTKVELKNMNSIAFLERGVAHELARQASVYESGGTVKQDTVHYDPVADTMTSMRSKEEADDYRYFPEPDLAPLAPEADLIERLREGLPELPAGRLRRFEVSYALPFRAAADLALSPPLSAYFEEVAALTGDPRVSANWVLNEFSRHLNEDGATPESSPVRPPALAALVGLVEDGTLGSAGAKQVFAALVAGEGGGDPARIVAERGLGQISDEGELRRVVEEVVRDNAVQAEQFRSGKEAVLGYLVGQVMRSTGGRADPKAVQALLREALN